MCTDVGKHRPYGSRPGSVPPAQSGGPGPLIRVSPANFGPPANSHGPTGHGSLLCHTHGGRPVYSRPSCDLLRYHAISCETCHDFHMISGKRNFPVSELKLFASARSAGKDIKTPFGGVCHARCHAQCMMDAACAPLQRHDNSRARAAANNTRCTRHHALHAGRSAPHPRVAVRGSGS